MSDYQTIKWRITFKRKRDKIKEKGNIRIK